MNTEKTAVTGESEASRVYESDGVLANIEALIQFLQTHNGLPAGLWIRTMKDAQATLVSIS